MHNKKIHTMSLMFALLASAIFGMSFMFSEMQLAQDVDDAHSMAKVMAQQNPKATMHSILAMTPTEIDAMIQRVQGGSFS